MSDRTVATDALATLGTIIDETQKRDAIHLAVMPAVARERFLPGQHVGIVDGVATADAFNPLGIVDPFLTAPVQPGERFWLVIYPRVITSLRHVWSHPAIAEEDAAPEPHREASRLWLKDYAERLLSYEPEYGRSKFDVLIECAESGSFGEDLESPERSPDETFWMHFERYVGRKVERHDWFRCAC